MSACECPLCHRLFTGLKPFDRHQKVDYSTEPNVTCLDPAEAGLVQNQYGRWGAAPDPERPNPWAEPVDVSSMADGDRHTRLA